MTGQLKEEILAHWGELGILVQDGALRFAPILLGDDEFLDAPDSFNYVDVRGQEQTVALPAGSLAFTFCQTPIVYTRGERAEIVVSYVDGRSRTLSGSRLDRTTSQQIFSRDGEVRLLRITLVKGRLDQEIVLAMRLSAQHDGAVVELPLDPRTEID